MRLSEAECWRRLAAAPHGVLATVHPERGVDAVPVVFAVVDRTVVVPIDRVKDKRSTDLQRVRNLEREPRCALLVDHYEDDWSRLWWVRLHAEGALVEAGPDLAGATAALAERYPAYRDPGAIVAVLHLTPTRITGWSA
jgi:PPOX class probable F420-dependent enzyme